MAPSVRAVDRVFEYWTAEEKFSELLVTPAERAFLEGALEEAARSFERGPVRLTCVEGALRFKLRRRLVVAPARTTWDLYDATADPCVSRLRFDGRCPGCDSPGPLCALLFKDFALDHQCCECKAVFPGLRPDMPDMSCAPPRGDELGVVCGSDQASVEKLLVREAAERLAAHAGDAFPAFRPVICATLKTDERAAPVVFRGLGAGAAKSIADALAGL